MNAGAKKPRPSGRGAATEASELEALKSCPLCGALPCDWVNDPHVEHQNAAPAIDREHLAKLLSTYFGFRSWGEMDCLDAADAILAEIDAPESDSQKHIVAGSVDNCITDMPDVRRETIEECAKVADKEAEYWESAEARFASSDIAASIRALAEKDEG